MTTISLIAAMAENRVIGSGGKIPWHYPADLQRFRELTMGHPLIVGRRTYEAIGKPLPGRKMIVLTRREPYPAEGCFVARTWEDAVRVAGGEEEIFVAGGEEVYRQALPFATRIYLTLVPGEYRGDTYFPDLPRSFREISREALPGEDGLVLVTFERMPHR